MSWRERLGSTGPPLQRWRHTTDGVQSLTVSTAVTDLSGVSDYQLRLPSFEGPLDVLLRLIERHQLQITDVSLVMVTSQFLTYLDGLLDTPSATVAEFAAVGARLVLIKSRSLLPRPADPDDAEPEDLIQQLVEYRSVKEAALHLAERDLLAAGAFERGGAVALPASTAPPRLTAQPPTVLVRALRRRLSRIPQQAGVISSHPVVTLREMVERVLASLGSSQALTFSTIRRDCRDRHDVLTAFLAILVLMRRQAIDAHQAELFGEILMRRRATPRPFDPATTIGDTDDA